MSASLETTFRSASPPSIEDIDSQYKILGPLGSSLTGKSFLARHRELDRLVVVKLMHVAADSRVRERFEREARALAQVRDDHVARLLAYGRTADGRRYMIVEHVEGQTLRHALQRWGRLPERRALRILDQLARGLAAVHEHGLVHRNLKPENVLLGQAQDGRELVKLTNFGLVRSDHDHGYTTKTGPMYGTPRYWAPEQVLGEPTDARTDVYGFGVLAFELLTGSTPFDSSTTIGFAWQHTRVRPPRPIGRDGHERLRHELEYLLGRCLAKRPEDRFASFKEVRAALARGRAVGRRRPRGFGERVLDKLAQPETWVVAATAFLAGLIGAMLGG